MDCNTPGCTAVLQVPAPHHSLALLVELAQQLAGLLEFVGSLESQRLALVQRVLHSSVLRQQFVDYRAIGNTLVYLVPYHNVSEMESGILH